MKNVIYVIFFLSAFANMSIFGHIYFVEIPMVVGVFMLLSNRDPKALAFNRLDKLVVIYAVFSFLSVVVGIDSLYESARHYRLTVLTPVLIYFVVRFGSSSIQQLQKAIFFIIPGTVWQGALLVQYYVLHGDRPVGVEGAASTITLGALLAISLFVMLFNFKKRPKVIMNLLRYGLICLLILMLIITGTRAALLGFVILAPVIFLVWNVKSRRVWVGRAMMSGIGLLLLLIFSGSILFSDIQIENAKEKGTSVERVFDVDMLLNDVGGRIAFWGIITNKALDRPFFGSGAASHDVGRTGGTLVHLGSAHNILISVILTSGLPGLIILIAIIAAAYRVFKVIDDELLHDCLIGKSMLGGISVMLMVAITNDFSGGRVFIWFLLLAICARMLNELPRTSTSAPKQDNDKQEKCQTKKLSILHLKS